MPNRYPYYNDTEQANRVILSMKDGLDKAQAIIFQQWLVIAKQEKVIEALKRKQRTELLAEVEG